MKKRNVVKKYKALEKQFGFVSAKEINANQLEDARTRVVACISNDNRGQLDFALKRDGGWKKFKESEYFTVAAYCVHFLATTTACFDSREDLIKAFQEPGGKLIRNLSFAYAVYWNLNDGYILGNTMQDVLRLVLRDGQFFRNYRTFKHVNINPLMQAQATQLITEIFSLHDEYFSGTSYGTSYDEPLRVKKPSFKPWLVSILNPTQVWVLPQHPQLVLQLIDEGARQTIKGNQLTILIDYSQSSLWGIGRGPLYFRDGVIEVRVGNSLVYREDDSFAITIDINTGQIAVDSEMPGRRKWLLDMIDAQPPSSVLSAAIIDQIDELVLEAQHNILCSDMSTSPVVSQSVSDHLCLHAFDREPRPNKFFQDLPMVFKSYAVCEAALSYSWQAFRYLPQGFCEDTGLALLYLNSLPEENRSFVWENLPDCLPVSLHTEDFAKLIIDREGTKGYGWLPEKLRTESIVTHAVTTAPNCLDDIRPVFSNAEERDAFLERNWPGIVREIEVALDFKVAATSADAFKFVLLSRQVTGTNNETLPIFD